MPSVVVARRLPEATIPETLRDAAGITPYLEDASGVPPGAAPGVVRPRDEPQAAAFLRETDPAPVLPQAARTSLTGGAVPRGEIVISVERLDEVESIDRDRGRGARCTVGAGLRLSALQERLDREGLYYPPVPTYREAMVGGTVATNAGGAATFKYGATRRWVRGLRVLLAGGDLLEIERGQAVARVGEAFEIVLADDRRLRVPVPTYELPRLKKLSAGYHAADPLDLVDLFVGSEGTLGLITAVTLDLVPSPRAVVSGLLFCDDAGVALASAEALRGIGRQTVRSIEWLDANSLALLRRTPRAERPIARLPDDAGSALIFELELDSAMDDETAREALVARLCRVLPARDVLDRLELAFPGDSRGRRRIGELRERVPLEVGEIVRGYGRRDPAVCKVGGDLAVPFDQLEGMIALIEDGYVRRGLDHAVWGHLADGNLHPNALPHDARQVRLAREALIEFSDEAVRRGGTPLSEHGVGRSPLKQELLRRFLGADAVAQMRRIKRALDPGLRFAPGVLFPA